MNQCPEVDPEVPDTIERDSAKSPRVLPGWVLPVRDLPVGDPGGNPISYVEVSETAILLLLGLVTALVPHGQSEVRYETLARPVTG